ncbi:MAG: phosphatidate cytidylyltransferase [Acidobacteriota bacterium]
MNKRVATSLIALPVLILTVVLPELVSHPSTKWPFAFLTAIVIGAGIYEFFSLTKHMQLNGDASIAYCGAALLFVAFFVDAPRDYPTLLILSLLIFTATLLITQTFRFQADFSKMLAGTGVTLLGVIYVAFLGGYMLAIRNGFENSLVSNLSTKLLGFLFLVVMGADTGAYYVGRSFGKHKIVPKISPGKSWEGLIGGIVLSGALALGASYSFFRELEPIPGLALASTMTVIGFFGDIVESAFKRGAGLKDAASILPGHGGILDRLDSILLNAPLVYYFSIFYFG